MLSPNAVTNLVEGLSPTESMREFKPRLQILHRKKISAKNQDDDKWKVCQSVS